MEGLVKGVLNVTLGNDENDRDNQDRDEQSRSTWAQVVTGEQEDEGVNSDHRHGYNREASPQGYERNEDKRRDDFNQSSWNQKEDEGNNDGWETVQKNPTKRHQQVKMDYWDNYKKPLDEQDYSNEVEYGVDLKPTEDELSDLSTTCTNSGNLILTA